MSTNNPEGVDLRENRRYAQPDLLDRLEQAAPPPGLNQAQALAIRAASPGPRERSPSPALQLQDGESYVVGTSNMPPPVLSTEQQRLESDLGGAIGWGLASPS